VDHVHIGDGAVVGAGSGVIRDVPPGQKVLGQPARPERDLKRSALLSERLPEMHRDIKRIKRALNLTDEKAA
jgi:UDP-3-O-[3-hydroxymyristoyl] glucosamine N-acyltransferase